MQNPFRWSLSLLPCLVALALLPAQSAEADTVSVFDVLGRAFNRTTGSLGSCAAGATCHFTGTLTVDVTSTPTNPLGSVDAVDITFPGFTAFDTVGSSGPAPFPLAPAWLIEATNGTPGDAVFLVFTTTPTPASLVGFTGGPIIGGSGEGSNMEFYTDLRGTITLVPEPSSLGLLAIGLLAFAGIVRLRQGVFRTT